MVKSKIIVVMDGGICSQMHQYLLGCIFLEKKYNVSFDLIWFKKYAKDVDGVFERNFDILKAFPEIKFQKANQIEVIIYRYCYPTQQNYFDHSDEDLFLFDITPPKYLGGYFHSPKELWTDLFPKYFQLDCSALDEKNKMLYNEIENRKKSVAIHVRRGDLKRITSTYGEPADKEYFTRAILYMYKKLETPFFYIFSDEPEWVKNKLIKELPIQDCQYKIVDLNGSDKGYMDLFLIGRCTHQITSKGSLGKFGALLANSPEKIVTLCDDPVEYVWKDRLSNTVFL
jgi:hypothetical protein